MTATYATAEAKARLSELVNRVVYGDERVVIMRRGKPVAALVSVEDLHRLESPEAETATQEAEAARQRHDLAIPAETTATKAQRTATPASHPMAHDFDTLRASYLSMTRDALEEQLAEIAVALIESGKLTQIESPALVETEDSSETVHPIMRAFGGWAGRTDLDELVEEIYADREAASGREVAL